MVGPMLLAAIGELTSQFLQTQWNLTIPWWLFTIAFALILWGIGMLGISRSATTALVFLVLEVGVMLALFATIFAKGGAQGVTLAPFNPANSFGGFSGLGIGLLWGILYFVGFESAGTLGEETRNARSSIPVALFSAAIVIGIYYVLSGWAAAIGFGSSHVNAFVNDSSPWITLTQTYWGSGLVWLVSLTALNSIFANLISGINATVRVLFSMGREGIISRRLGQTTTHGNPSVALTVYMIFALAFALIGGALLSKVNYLRTVLRIRSAESTSLCDDQVG